MTRRTFLVDPSARWLEYARRSVSDAVNLTTFTDFSKARAQLLTVRPQLVATNLRLGAYNGLHLVHLVASLGIEARCIVFSDHPDPVLIREAQEAGAFYEPASALPFALASYASAVLPPRDQRSAERIDRRAIRRGGRRAADALALTSDDGGHLSLT
jgi:DNA-binding NarL/FixJ family response regulator